MKSVRRGRADAFSEAAMDVFKVHHQSIGCRLEGSEVSSQSLTEVPAQPG